MEVAQFQLFQNSQILAPTIGIKQVEVTNMAFTTATEVAVGVADLLSG